MAFFSIVGAVGFATFGKASQGLILNNYANTDAVMGFSRIAVFVSIVFSYPLAFVGLRDGGEREKRASFVENSER